MPAKKLLSVFVFVAVGFLAWAASAPAQSSGTAQKKSLIDRLDDFGKTIFGGIVPVEKPSARAVPQPEPESRFAPRRLEESHSVYGAGVGGEDEDDALEETVPAARAGSVMDPPRRRSDPIEKSAKAEADFTPENMPSALDRKELPTSKPGARPLHERLSILRQSPFERPSAAPSAAPRPADSLKQTASPPPKANKIAASLPPDAESKPKPDAPAPPPAKRPLVAQRVAPALPTDAEQRVKPVAPSGDAPAAVETAPPTSNPAADNVLFARKGPMLSVETTGPRTIIVGRASTYQVYLLNSGETAAEALMVYIALPAWAEIAGIEATRGEPRSPDAAEPGSPICWKLDRLEAKSRERLSLRIVPRQSRPFDLAVRWEYQPTASQAMIEVQEARLGLHLDGPREVLYGKKELYRLKLANTGNGPAANVVITLVPVGSGDNVPASHKIGLLAAGEERSLDVELTARQAGELSIRAEAVADGDVRAELSERVLVRRADLKVELEGPKVQYVGAVASYVVRIRNLGTAPARNVNLSVSLPAGAKYLSGIEGARTLGPMGDKLDWTIETINPDVELAFNLKCGLGAAGASRMRLAVQADDDLIASAETIVQVESVANLTMEVRDPDGPVPVGDEAVYEVRVRNRGTKEATGVEVLVYFSRGIEPVAAEGAACQLAAGQVMFQPIASLAPGEEKVLTIRAKAETAGNHVFRAEAHCKLLNTRLVSEATNLFYGEGLADAPSARKAPAPEPPAAVYDAMRTIPRPLPKE